MFFFGVDDFFCLFAFLWYFLTKIFIFLVFVLFNYLVAINFVKCNNYSNIDVFNIFPYLEREVLQFNVKLCEGCAIRNTVTFSSLSEKLDLNFAMQFHDCSLSTKTVVRREH